MHPLTILRPLIPYVLTVALTVLVMLPFYRSSRLQCKQVRHQLDLALDSLDRLQDRAGDLEYKLATLQARDNEIQLAYYRSVERFRHRLDSLRLQTTAQPVSVQRDYITRQIGAVPVPDWHPRVAYSPVPIQQFKLTCYDSTGLVRITEATARLSLYQAQDSVRTRAYSQLVRQFTDYRQAVAAIGDYPWYRSKGKAIRRLNRWSTAPVEL